MNSHKLSLIEIVEDADTEGVLDAEFFHRLRVALAQHAHPEDPICKSCGKEHVDGVCTGLRPLCEHGKTYRHTYNEPAPGGLNESVWCGERQQAQPLTDEMIEAEALHEYGAMENADNITRWSYKSFIDGMKRARDRMARQAQPNDIGASGLGKNWRAAADFDPQQAQPEMPLEEMIDAAVEALNNCVDGYDWVFDSIEAKKIVLALFAPKETMP